MFLREFVLVVFLFHLTIVAGLETGWHKREKRQNYGITIIDIERMLRKLENKLARHEYRESQLADLTMKSLNALNAGQSTTKKDMKIVSKQLANMEEKMFAIESLISTTDERQRHMMRSLSEGVNRLITISRSNDLLPLPEFKSANTATTNDIKSIMMKIDAVDGGIQNKIEMINDEVKIVGGSINHHMDQLRSNHDRLLSDFNTCNNEHMNSIINVTEMLTKTSNKFEHEFRKVKNRRENTGNSEACNAAMKEIAHKIDSLDDFQRKTIKEMTVVEIETQKALLSQKRDLKNLLEKTQGERQEVKDSFLTIVTNLQNFQSESQNQLETLESNIKTVLHSSSDKINSGVNNVASTLKLKSTNILDAMEDSASQNVNIQETMRDSFLDLTGEIRGLKKVEQVMISTADAVLDTKRSIEFGIQQVIIELTDIVRNNGQTINSTLTDKINNILLAILNNQTSALTNMTAKMELSISQVWRQIGVMHERIMQSVDILDDLQSTTSQQMNQSLNTVDHMDGTVGKINSKVAGVEDDLNYLLGRLTLVVSEFSQLKSGVGEELNRLRDMAESFSNEGIVEYKLQDDESDSDS